MRRYIYLIICLVSILSLFCSCKQNKHTVTIIFENGEKEIIEEIKNGSKITEPNFNFPNEVNDIKYVDESGNEFNFNTEIKSDLTIYGKFVYNEYVINFYNYDGNLIETHTLPYGSEIIFPESPSREGGEEYNYVFTNWGSNQKNVNGNIDFVAQYEKVYNEYVINFYNYDKTLVATYTLPYGSEIIFPETPSREGGTGYTYVFKDWGLKQTIVTKNLDFTARYTKVYDEMTVTALNLDGSVYTIEKCDYDSYINTIEEPEFEKDSNKYYRFYGWYDKDTEELFDFDKEVTKNTTIYPKYDIYNYEETTLENSTISFVGDSISTFYDENSSVNSLYGGNNQYYYPIYSQTVKSVELTWWHQTYTRLGLKLGVNNSWSGSAAYGSGNSAGMSENRLKTLGDNGTPNIVVIYLGTNDNVNGHTVENLKLAYVKMIDYITENYIDFSNNTAKVPYIYLVTNGYSGYSGYNYTEERRLEYNEMFKSLSKTYKNVRIFDLALHITKDNYSKCLGDGLHYNADGMKLIADKLVEQLTNDFSASKRLQKNKLNSNKVVYYLEKEEKNY